MSKPAAISRREPEPRNPRSPPLRGVRKALGPPPAASRAVRPGGCFWGLAWGAVKDPGKELDVARGGQSPEWDGAGGCVGELPPPPQGKPSPPGKRPWDRGRRRAGGGSWPGFSTIIKIRRRYTNAAVPSVSVPPRAPQLSAPAALGVAEGPHLPRGRSPMAAAGRGCGGVCV